MSFPALNSILLFRYIQAATSPKDVVIVVDVSGSMKGLRLTIAKHTINTILDTLGENDFVNIIAVSISSNTNANKGISLRKRTLVQARPCAPKTYKSSAHLVSFSAWFACLYNKHALSGNYYVCNHSPATNPLSLSPSTPPFLHKN